MPTTPEQKSLPFVEMEIKELESLFSKVSIRYDSYAESNKDSKYSLNYLNTLSFILHVMDIPQMIHLRAVFSSKTGKLHLSPFQISHH